MSLADVSFRVPIIFLYTHIMRLLEGPIMLSDGYIIRLSRDPIRLSDGPTTYQAPQIAQPLEPDSQNTL